MQNPLSIILNSIDVIKIKHSEKLTNDILKLFLMIDRATSRIAFQLDEILNFVRQSPMEYEHKSMNEINSSSLFRIVIPDGVSIILPSDDGELDCDPRKLESVFSNLIVMLFRQWKIKER